MNMNESVIVTSINAPVRPLIQALALPHVKSPYMHSEPGVQDLSLEIGGQA